MKKLITTLLLLMPILLAAQVPQRSYVAHQHNCYTDSIYYCTGWKQGYFGYDTIYIETTNPYGNEYEFTIDYHFNQAPWKVCVDEDGDVWCSDWNYYRFQGIGIYGYTEYRDRQLIYTRLSRSQMPPDYVMYKPNWWGPDQREEDHYARMKFSSRAKSIRYGFISPIWANGWMHPKCFVWDRATAPTTTNNVKYYYDLMGRHVVPQHPGIYILTDGYTSRKVFLSEFDLMAR